MNKIRQIIYDMRHQPVIAWVTVLATAMSIFLIMIIVMIQRVGVVPFAPESCRDRLLLGEYFHTESVENKNNSSSGGMSYDTARTLYADLDGVEHTSYLTPYTERMDVCGTTGDNFEVNARLADAEFFDIFDHPLISGRYYTAAEANALQRVVVIAESTARRAFGTTACEGMPLAVNHEKYTVTGVVNDNSPLALTGSGDLFIAIGPGSPNITNHNRGVFGEVAVALLVKDGVDFQSVRDQVKARYAIMDTQLASQGNKSVYHEAPFDQETLAYGTSGSNTTPDHTVERNMRYILYAILLIVPAINLSSMLHSRMRRRVSEFGVRRAYGCTRRRIITDIVAENLVVTVAGGVLGVALAMTFALTYSGLYETMENYGDSNLTPAMTTVFNWGTVAIALALCFILNIISAAVPAWQASRLNPVEAINAR